MQLSMDLHRVSSAKLVIARSEQDSLPKIPDDRQMMLGSIDELRRIAGGSNVSIEAEPHLSRGGARVRTEFGEVDASIETLLSTVAQRLGIRQSK